MIMQLRHGSYLLHNAYLHVISVQQKAVLLTRCTMATYAEPMLLCLWGQQKKTLHHVCKSSLESLC